MESNVAGREQMLLRQLPTSNRPGAFPVVFLSPGERIIYETKPGVWGFVAVPLSVNILWSLLLIGTLATQPGAAGNPALWFFLVFPWIWVLLRLQAWKGTAYAMTDRRVIRRGGKGGAKLQDARYDLISAVESTGSTTLRFRIIAYAGSAEAAHGVGFLNRYVVWSDLAQAAEVQVFAQEYVSLQAMKVREEVIRGQLRARAMANKVRCAYCNTLMELSKIDLTTPKCSSCGAPLVAK